MLLEKYSMKTLLVPIDFTNSTANVIDFAAEWAKKYLYERIILLRTFYSSMYENMIMSADFSTMNEEYLNKKRRQEKELLKDLRKELNAKAGEKILVQTAITELPLTRSIIELIKTEKPEMILLGSDPSLAGNESFIAGNVISIARLSPVRVLIVPYQNHYREITKALVPVDFKTIYSLHKIDRLRTSSRWHDVELMVLNVNAVPPNPDADKNFKESESHLHEYLKNFKHHIYYESNKNVINGILNWNKLNEVQLMIALPGVHSFLYSITHKSVSEALYMKCRVPVMILK